MLIIVKHDIITQQSVPNLQKQKVLLVSKETSLYIDLKYVPTKITLLIKDKSIHNI